MNISLGHEILEVTLTAVSI